VQGFDLAWVVPLRIVKKFCRKLPIKKGLKMKKYKYTWEQSDTYVCEFEAKNEEEAKEIINDNFDYNKGKLIGGDFNSLELKEVK
tara:strand:+ start:155 stop:409 length:255 start_codon:yes stop_codon:yes gene_type:complete